MKNSKKANRQPARKNRTFIIVLVLLVVGGGSFGITKYVHSLHHEETDDAQIETTISPVISRISGYVTEVRVKDNQRVKAGDTLLILDNRDPALKLEQAKAALAIAQSSLGVAEAGTTVARANIEPIKASVGAIDAQIEAARVTVWRAGQDYSRFLNLIKDHSITQQQFEQAQAAKETAERQLEVLQEQRNQASKQASAASSQSMASSRQISVARATIRQREVDVENAELNLSYTVITAPVSGVLSEVNIQPGQYLPAGASLISIVPVNDLWVVANFKETQLTKMKVGQKVTVHVDAYPRHAFEADLASFSPATGARFALLPPDNASGNFVKVVQRLPVKIEFLNKEDSLLTRLRPGLNVTVDVHLD